MVSWSIHLFPRFVLRSKNTHIFCTNKILLLFQSLTESKQFSPFGVEQVSDFLVVNLHVGDFHREALALLRLLHSPVEQGAAEARNQTRLLYGAHHGVGLARAWKCTHDKHQRIPLLMDYKLFQWTNYVQTSQIQKLKGQKTLWKVKTHGK